MQAILVKPTKVNYFAVMIIFLVLVKQYAPEDIRTKAITNFDCMDKPQENHRSQLTCHINGDVKFGIEIVRPNNDLIIKCDLDTVCSQVRDSPHYCFIMMSHTEIIIVIDHFRRNMDEGEWTCRDGPPPGVGKSTCNKKSSRSYSETHLPSTDTIMTPAKTYFDCMDKAEEGLPTKLTCYIKGTIKTAIQISRPDTITVLMCDGKTYCDRQVGGGFCYLMNSPTQITITIAKFNKKTDEGRWFCHDVEYYSVGNTTCIKKTQNTRTVASGIDVDFSQNTRLEKSEETLVNEEHRSSPDRAKSPATTTLLAIVIAVATIGSVVFFFLVSVWKRAKKPKVIYETFVESEKQGKFEKSSAGNKSSENPAFEGD